MHVQAPEVQSAGEGVVPVVLDAGDRLKRQVVQSDDDQRAEVEQGEAVERQQELVLGPPQWMAQERRIQRGRRPGASPALPEGQLGLGGCRCHRKSLRRLRRQPVADPVAGSVREIEHRGIGSRFWRSTSLEELMAERWFSEHELEQMSRPTMDRAIEALDRGDLDEARARCEEMK